MSFSLFQRIFAIVLLVALLISACAIICMKVISDAGNRLLSITLAAHLSHSATQIVQQLLDVEAMSAMFLADSSIQDNLATLKDSADYIQRTSAYQALSYAVSEYYQSVASVGVHYMNVYNDRLICSSKRVASNRVPNDVHAFVVEQALAMDGAPAWITQTCDEYGLYYARAIRRINFARLDVLGTLVVRVDLDAIVRQIADASRQFQNARYLFFDGDHQIYHSPELPAGAGDAVMRSIANEYAIVRIDGELFFAVRGTIPGFLWGYICMVPYGSIARSQTAAWLICLTITLCALAAASIWGRSLIRFITRHFDALVAKMKGFATGTVVPSNGYDYANRKDEIGELHRQFDTMAQEVNDLIRTNYANELLKKEAQLKALEYQIDPHFLYNTLSTVSWRARALGARDISAMVDSLGALLRVKLTAESVPFTLGQEIDVVDSYMVIQQIRFEDRLCYEKQIDADCLSTRVPKLSLQPLVENAIQYALEEICGGCRIIVRTVKDGDRLRIQVINDGSYFEEELLQKLESGEIRPNGFGIGMLNIHKRLRLTFGEPYGLCVYNKDGCAVAEVLVPFSALITEEAMANGSAFDC